MSISGSTFDDFFADLGSGDDELMLLGNLFDLAMLEGGLGQDRLVARKNIGALLAAGFEEENIS